MKSSDPTYIPMMENIRDLLKDTIFADPAHIKKAVKATTPKKKKK